MAVIPQGEGDEVTWEDITGSEQDFGITSNEEENQEEEHEAPTQASGDIPSRANWDSDAFYPYHQSVAHAEDAYAAWLADQINQNDPGSDDGGGPPMPASQVFEGSITVPDEVGRGEAFDVEVEVTNTGDEPYASVFVPAVTINGEAATFADRHQTAISSGDTESWSWTVPRGQFNVSPGDYQVYLIAESPVQDAMVHVGETTLTVTGDEGGDAQPGDGEGWGEVRHIRELVQGWHLYAEVHSDGEQVRYQVVAKNSAGELIWMASNGTVQFEPAYLSNADEVAEALQAWMERLRNGDVPEDKRPDETQQRPAPQEVGQGAAANPGRSGSLQHQVMSLVDDIGGLMPILLIVAGIGVYSWREGEVNRKMVAAGGSVIVALLYFGGDS